ncbi:flippase [Vibrio diabolicus]|uniref:flippase n=1 Tax=Vibrio diabolicus TaxID=50719 RepID=UPI0022A813A2|nr:flippase [Vibrio diabolicus]MCZ0924049.1 flippase [Vibrio diabolicus]
MNSTKKALRNTAWLFSERIITLAITFLINIFLARYLAPEQFGQYNFIVSFLALLAPFTSLGLNALVTREIVNGRSQYEVLCSSFLLRLIGGLVGATIAVVGILIWQSSIELVDPKWLILAAVINISSALYVIEFYFQAEVASKYIVFIRVTTLIISSAAKLVGILLKADLSFFIWVFFVELIIRGVLYVSGYIYYNKHFSEVITLKHFSWNKTYAFSLLDQSKWLVLSGFMSVVYLKIDQLMIGQMVGATELGVYSVAARLSEVWYFFPLALTTSFFPKLLKARGNRESYNFQLEQLCGVLLWMAIIIAIAVSLLGGWLVPFAFGEPYAPAAPILTIHIWAGCFIFMRALLSKWLIAEGLLKFSLFTHGIAAIVNIVLNYFLIPKFGGEGAAIATLISYASASYFVLWLHPKTQIMALIMTKSVFMPATYCIRKFK